ncbi:MAG: hypothetical protein AAF938_04310 [Myxococcota bacterium]
MLILANVLGGALMCLAIPVLIFLVVALRMPWLLRALRGGNNDEAVGPNRPPGVPHPAAASNTKTAAMNHASDLLLVHRDFDAAIAAYDAIARDYPEERAVALNQAGVAHFFKGDYERAVEFYRAAGDAGFDPSMTRDNLEEAEDAIRSRR